MFRRLSTKWVLTVLAAVIVPFLGYAWFLSQQMKSRESEVVRYLLSTLAAELGDRVDNDLAERKWDVEFGLARTPMATWAANDDPNQPEFYVSMGRIMTQFCAESNYYDRALLLDRKGHVVVMNEVSGDAAFEQTLRQRDFTHESWFQEGLSGRTALIDNHVSDLVRPSDHRAA